MKELFNEVLQVEGVKGALLFDTQGRIVYREFVKDDPGNPASAPWWSSFVGTLNGVRELELVCDRGRLYIRRAAEGYLMIWMDDIVAMAIIRLNCDVLLHGLKNTTAKRKRKGLFRRWG